jgi:hypothetical protein
VREPELRRTGRGLTAIDGAIAMVAILLVVQMWLLTATLESSLAGYEAAALPAALVSGVLFSGALGLYLFIERLDRGARRPGDRQVH